MADVNVDFSNTGEEIIVVNYNDQKGAAQSFVVRPQQIIRQTFPVGFSFYFNFSRGRFGQYATYVYVVAI